MDGWRAAKRSGTRGVDRSTREVVRAQILVVVLKRGSFQQATSTSKPDGMMKERREREGCGGSRGSKRLGVEDDVLATKHNLVVE